MADPTPLTSPDPVDPSPADPSASAPAEPAGGENAGEPTTRPPPPVAKAAGPAKRKRRRRWPFVVLGVLLFIVLLVVLAPTIASMGWVRSAVVAQVNKHLNGSVAINDWSFSWTGGQRVEGVRVLDAEGHQVLQLQSLTTQLSL